MEYPAKIRMLRTNGFGQLGQVPLDSDKGRVYELVSELSDALKQLIGRTKSSVSRTTSASVLSDATKWRIS